MIFFLCQYRVCAQLTVNPNQTAAVLAGSLSGPGVIVTNPTLTCTGVANGLFTNSGTLLSMSSGIVLTNGKAVQCSGVEPPLTSTNLGTSGDPTFVTLGILPPGTNTYDACILEFDVVASGDTLGFNYQFGSEEYRTAVCSQYNDAFGFFISGPGITGTPNIALVPGTSYPVEINTVNDGIPGTSGGVLSNCTSIGPGVPFTSLYLDNTGGTTLAYRGYTDKFRAFHSVIPCDTYHLRLSIVDAGNAIYDSGVFLEASSLKSNGYSFNHTATVGATVNGVPNTIVKGCSPTTIQVVASNTVTTATTLNLSYGGTAVNGVDVSTLPPTITIAPDSTTFTFSVSAIPTPTTGLKTLTIYLHGICGIADSISINIIDTPSAVILTPDTNICAGSPVVMNVSGSAGLQYSWSPASSLNSTNVMDPTATPTVTTTYVMTATLPNSGCPPINRNVTLSVVNSSVTLSTTDTSICNGGSLTLTASGAPGLSYSWSPAAGLSATNIPNPVASPSGTVIYTITATGPGGICPSSASVKISLFNFNAMIITPDTTTCGDTFQVRATGTPGLSYLWSPATSVNNDTLMDPIVYPKVNTVFTLTATMPCSGCPPLTLEFTVNMSYPYYKLRTKDTTICTGSTVFIKDTAAGPYIYRWEPGIGLSAYNIPDPVATPTVSTTYTVTAANSNHSCPFTTMLTIDVVQPAAIIQTKDTTICRGDSIQLMVDTSLSCTYIWTPATGLSNPNIADPVVNTDTLRKYVLTTSTRSAGCVAQDSVSINVSGKGVVRLDQSDSVFCVESGISFVLSGTVQSTGFYWHFGDGDSMKNENPVMHGYVEPGTYSVTATALFGGCADTILGKVVNVFQNPQLNLGHDTSICPGEDPIYVHDLVNVGGSGAVWHWNTGATTSGIYIGVPGVYFATVSMNGCEAIDSIHVTQSCYLDIPNAFTPNGDGVNDYFLPRQLLSSGLTYFSMTIFNRWGQAIFQTSEVDGRGWDGTINGMPQPEGVFVYIIDAAFMGNAVQHYKGNLTLIR